LWKSYNWVAVKYLPSLFKDPESLIFNDDLSTFQKSMRIVDQAVESKDTLHPKFVYCHLFIPHEPYKFDSSGNILAWSKSMYQGKEADNYFLDQLAYCRKLIIRLKETVLKHPNRPSVIIFQGDHGFREERTNDSGRVFQIMDALYLPDGKDNNFSDTFYSPNTFRLLLNRYFNQRLPMLPAKSSFIKL
jgi:hypothetical protein